MKWCSKHFCRGVEKSKCVDKMCMEILCWNKTWLLLCHWRCHWRCSQLRNRAESTREKASISPSEKSV